MSLYDGVKSSVNIIFRVDRVPVVDGINKLCFSGDDLGKGVDFTRYYPNSSSFSIFNRPFLEHRPFFGFLHRINRYLTTYMRIDFLNSRSFSINNLLVNDRHVLGLSWESYQGCHDILRSRICSLKIDSKAVISDLHRGDILSHLVINSALESPKEYLPNIIGITTEFFRDGVFGGGFDNSEYQSAFISFIFCFPSRIDSLKFLERSFSDSGISDEVADIDIDNPCIFPRCVRESRFLFIDKTSSVNEREVDFKGFSIEEESSLIDENCFYRSQFIHGLRIQII